MNRSTRSFKVAYRQPDANNQDSPSLFWWTKWTPTTTLTTSTLLVCCRYPNHIFVEICIFTYIDVITIAISTSIGHTRNAWPSPNPLLFVLVMSKGTFGSAIQLKYYSKRNFRLTKELRIWICSKWCEIVFALNWHNTRSINTTRNYHQIWMWIFSSMFKLRIINLKSCCLT